MAELVGGRYRLEDLLGVGRDEFWRAFDEVDERVVGVRLLRSWPPADTWFAERFLVNIRGVARSGVDGFVEILDYGVDESVGVYLVVEFVPGESLSSVLEREGTLGVGLTMDIVAQAADALAAAHAVGVVHRGIKPSKMFLRPAGRLVLADLWGGGFAPRSYDASVSVELARYLSPEEAMGESAGTGSDVYALGVVAYRCLAGRPPFDSANPLELAVMHVRHTPVSLAESIPATVRMLVAATLAKKPAGRPSAVALAAEARGLVGRH